MTSDMDMFLAVADMKKKLSDSEKRLTFLENKWANIVAQIDTS